MKTLQWYDYIACMFFADIITTGLFSGNAFLILAGYTSYDIYEHWRRS